MNESITYYVQRYRPKFEAISKEVSLLAKHFAVGKNNVRIHDLHLDNILKLNFNRKKWSMHFVLYPFMAIFTKLSSRKSINHIYTSLGDLPYLPILSPKKTILTAAASCSLDKVKKRKNRLRQIKKIIVESEIQKKQLELIGITGRQVELIYPPVNLQNFHYQKPTGKFKILYASCPVQVSDFKKRGIYLILDVARKLPTTEFTFAWRKGAYHEMSKLAKNTMNMILDNRILTDMNEQYAKVHCTIIPYTKFDDYLKYVPNSAIESLAAGKPLLVSSKTDLARIVRQEGCGIVFEPNQETLVQAIKEIKKNYSKYQKNCRKTAEKYFSEEIFIKRYEQIYEGLLKDK
jgi:glycosyltransferase involved in cell wall biosynthesis